ncbi:MAG TPA: helix-turn-helix domain-containing protein [Candidatus Polarisedimenticolaceae bacterium]|nr:helix-turn-helix domain-containing protein [Candidatus Polarisedimenticolaceae bacterium]
MLADELRVRILEALCDDEPRTTKQVAKRLGEKPTRLYHHVDALERVGLIRLAETRQVRGTVEKYYRAVAKVFRADSSLFRTDDAGEAAKQVVGVVQTMMLNTAEDLRRLIDAGHDVAGSDEALLSYTEVHASEEQIRRLREKLMAVLHDVGETGCDEESGGPGKPRRFRLTLAFFPLDL